MIKLFLLLATCTFIVSACRTRISSGDSSTSGTTSIKPKPKPTIVKPTVETPTVVKPKPTIVVLPETTSTVQLQSTDAEIMKISEELFKNADMSLAQKVIFNAQKRPVFFVKEEELKSIETIMKMRRLFDNYELDASKVEVETNEQRYEEYQFLDAVLKTKVMKILMGFFKKKQVKGFREKLTPKIEKENQKTLLRYLWFTTYARERGGPKGSSGFEHVFCQELITKNGVKEISGLHNWVYFRDQENMKKPRIAFQKITGNLMLSNNINVIKYQFSFDNMIKPTSAMFTGTTPELDMALYTLCVVMNRKECKVSLGGKTFLII